MAIQVEADGAENGSVHSVMPVALTAPLRSPPPGITPARPLPPCALPSHTLRKQTTCVAMPQAIAMIAFITEPSWPEVSTPESYQPTERRSASITSYAPAPLKPLGPNMPG